MSRLKHQMNLDDPLHKKTVSFSALLDRTHYRLVSDVGAAAYSGELTLAR